MSIDKIEVGDEVKIQLDLNDENPGVYGKVLHIPSATGDCWHVRDHDGSLRYVQTFCQIIQKEKHGSNT